MTQLADRSSFEILAPGTFTGSYLARVVGVKVTNGAARVQVRLFNFDHVQDQDGPIWARVAVPFANNGWGAFLLPSVGDEVLVTFLNGDPRLPVVVGSLWNGSASPPETLGGDGSDVDRWTLVGRHGTRIAIVEESEGDAMLRLETPGNVSAELRETAGGSLQLQAAGASITIDTTGISIQTDGEVNVQASTITMNASIDFTVNTQIATFSDMIICNTLVTNDVVADTYTPGIGNVW
jgi:uncharacterized protein involved in type VI secretion and phage assembly